eukprot:TRINITY_DN7373_c0_g1_i1.p1 TRINITY_DN7373_c0_g1~~TRINITY_DN7373_c0_g1_i1.p1  ORF type:complete len:404 (+),score=76.56 TRINITY_DN7373_c0_g1_i1:120-1214(+)
MYAHRHPASFPSYYMPVQPQHSAFQHHHHPMHHQQHSQMMMHQTYYAPPPMPYYPPQPYYHPYTLQHQQVHAPPTAAAADPYGIPAQGFLQSAAMNPAYDSGDDDDHVGGGGFSYGSGGFRGGYRGGFRGRGRGRGRGGFNQSDRNSDFPRPKKFSEDPEIPAHILLKVVELSENDSPEAVAAYRDSRKRNFPTRQNLLKKKLEEEEMKQRGELMPPRPGRFNSDTRKRKPDSIPEAAQPSLKEAKTSPEGEECTDQENQAEPATAPQPSQDKAKGNRKQICTWYLRGSCKFGSRCSSVHDPYERQKSIESFYSQPRRAGSLMMPKPSQNLLQKLLEKEIHMEQSLILQCLRYIVSSDFLAQEP